MWFNFLTHVKMSKKANILTAIGLATALTTTPANAEKIQDNSSSKSMEQVVCKTKLACEKLSISIQAQIKEIEDKENLTKEDKKERYLLKKKLIAVENNKQEEQKETISKQVEHKKSIEETDKKIEELRDALLSKID